MGLRARTFLLVAVFLLGASSCTKTKDQAGEAPPPQRAAPATWVRTELYFGRSKAGGEGGEISDAEWRAFLEKEVTARFPDGLTVLDASGQYRNAKGVIVKERTKLLVLLHKKAGADGKLGEIIAAYKKKFKQESVLKVQHAVEVLRWGCRGRKRAKIRNRVCVRKLPGSKRYARRSRILFRPFHCSRCSLFLVLQTSNAVGN